MNRDHKMGSYAYIVFMKTVWKKSGLELLQENHIDPYA
jgi:hypothetical protein